MFTTEELDIYLTQLGIPPGGRRLVERARRESPVREVQSRLGNVITDYQSEKMGGRRIEAESLHSELPAVVRYEHDSNVIEYYPQPTRIDLKISDEATGSSFRLVHIPDFLLLCKTGVIIEEWREEKRLMALAQKSPGRIYKDEQGHWRWPHVEAHLGSIGIEYRLRSADEHPRTYVQNLNFLADYLSSKALPLDERAREAIRSCFRERAYMTIGELISCGAPKASPDENEATQFATTRFTPDDIYTAIAMKQIAFDLDNDLLSETHRSLVYRDGDVLALAQTIESAPAPPRSDHPASIEVGTQILYDGRPYIVQLLGQDNVTLLSDAGASEMALSTLLSLHARGKVSIPTAPSPICIPEALAPIHALTPDEVQRANRRAALLRQAQSNPNAVPVSLRTLQRWRKAMRAAASATERNLQLVGHTRKQGNRLRKLGPDVIAMIHKVTKYYYNNPAAVTKKGAYIEFTKQCQAEHLVPCSYRAFCAELRSNSSVRKREGKRRAYQEEPIVWYLYATEPVHGVRPFQYVHIDHTQLEIMLRSPHFPDLIEKPWLTLALDAESRDAVGFYLSFEPPSYRSCMMVMRDIVRRHARLPETFVLDNGADFHSDDFKAVCKLRNVDIRWRPAAQPRHGTVIERAFGTTTTQLIHNMEGNTKLMRHVRSVTKSVRPEQFAVWTLPALSGALDYYFRQLYGAEPHPAHHEPPAEHLKRRLAETGLRTQRLISLSREFLIETCPAAEPKGTRCVDGQRGIKISHIWYWTDALRTGWNGREVPVRVDPWDARVCYVQLDGTWHQCTSKLVAALRTLTRVELESYFDEMSRRGGVKKKELTPERIAEWTKVLDASAFDARLRAAQGEQRATWDSLGITAVDPTVESPPSTDGLVPSDLPDLSPESDLTARLDDEDQESVEGQEVEYDLY